MVEDDEIKRILFSKLPPSARVTCVNLEPSCSPLELMDHLRKYNFWNGLEGASSNLKPWQQARVPNRQPRGGGAEPMQMDDQYAVGDFGIRDKVTPNGTLNFAEIKTAGGVMVAWKHLLK